MSKLGAALGFGEPDAESPAIAEDVDEMDEDAEVPSQKGSSAEVLAMKMFMSAKSPEDKVEAFKHLLESCGSY